MENTFTALAILLLLTIVASTFGRRLHQLFAPHEESVPFPVAFLAGIGGYTLWWLMMVPLGGGHTLVTSILFLLATLALAGHGILKQGAARTKQSGEHFYSLAIIHTVLLWPWLGLLLIATPNTLEDFAALHTVSALTAAGEWFSPTALAQLPQFLSPLGWLVPQAAASQPFADVPPTLAPLLNGITLILAAGLLAQAAETRPSWSNLPLAAASSLAMLILLLPVFTPTAMHGQFPQVAPILLLAVMVPLTALTTLPKGWGALPYALILVWFTSIHPLGLVLALAVAVIWLVRAICASGPTPRALLAGSLLAGLPILATVAQIHLFKSLPAMPLCLHLLAQPRQFPSCLPTVFPSQFPTWQPPLLILLASLSATALFRLAGPERWLHLIPFILTGVLLSAAQIFPETQPLWPHFLALCTPMLLLAPIRAWSNWYKHSRLRQRSYRNPWSIGILLLAVLMVIIFAVQPLLHGTRSPLLDHTAATAEEMRAMPRQSLPMPMATIGLPPLATAAMAYHLRHLGPVQSHPAGNTPQATHQSLRHAGYPSAWVGPQGAAQVMDITQPLEATILLETTPNALLIRSVYPLVSGTLSELDSPTQIK